MNKDYAKGWRRISSNLFAYPYLIILLISCSIIPSKILAQEKTEVPSAGNTTQGTGGIDVQSLPQEIQDALGPGSTIAPGTEAGVNPTQNVTLTPGQERTLNASTNREQKCDSYCDGKFKNTGLVIESILESLCCLLYGFVNAMADWATSLGNTVTSAIENL